MIMIEYIENNVKKDLKKSITYRIFNGKLEIEEIKSDRMSSIIEASCLGFFITRVRRKRPL
jgi:hypothetical protein